LLHNRLEKLVLNKCSKLKELICRYNKLTILDLEGCCQLQTVYCANNKIKEIKNVPKSLKKLSCENNRLKKLPEIPKKIEYIVCGGNKIDWKYIDTILHISDISSRSIYMDFTIDDDGSLYKDLNKFDIGYIGYIENLGYYSRNITKYREKIYEGVINQYTEYYETQDIGYLPNGYSKK
jgi:Leucine-rich repeat (LRR) protein